MPETFADELDAHIAESMKDPEYAAHHHWLEWRETHAVPFWDRQGITEAVFKTGFLTGVSHVS